MAAVSLADALDEFNFAATCKWQATGDTKNGVSENLKGIVLVHFFPLSDMFAMTGWNLNWKFHCVFLA